MRSMRSSNSGQQPNVRGVPRPYPVLGPNDGQYSHPGNDGTVTILREYNNNNINYGVLVMTGIVLGRARPRSLPRRGGIKPLY